MQRKKNASQFGDQDAYIQRNSLTMEQKAGFALLLVFALLAVSLGVLQMRNTIYNPLALDLPDQGANFASLVDEETRLQNIDTDQDGLNDYEELYFYETSPYLEDTDSDGKTDKEEIDSDEDPLCPQGKDCSGVQSTDTGPQDDSLLGNVEAPKPIDAVNLLGQLQTSQTASGEVNLSEEDLQNASAIANDPDLLRELLLQTGKITEEQLKGIDDETLVNFAKELLKQQEAQN